MAMLQVALLLMALQVGVQTPEPPPVQLVVPQGPAAPPPVITLQDALARAQKLNAQYLAVQSNVALAREDRLQARASRLPNVSQTTDYLGTQGNGVLPSGRFVSNDGVHVYRAWGVVHQDVNANTFLKTNYRSAQAAEALANAPDPSPHTGLFRVPRVIG